MILRNKKGEERKFRLLYKIEHNDNLYLVYEDYITKKIYAGKKKQDKLKKLEEDELNYINKLIEKVSS